MYGGWDVAVDGQLLSSSLVQFSLATILYVLVIAS